MRIALLGLLCLVGSCSSYDPVLVIAHRGATLTDVENSLEAFKAAKQQGADGVEFDVVLTRDGVDVVMHDDLLDRTTTCTGAVRDRTLAELASCKLTNGEPIRTLEQMLAEIGGDFSLLFVEIKVFDDRAVAQADDTIAQVLRSGHAAKIVISSYDETANKRLAERGSEGFMAGWDARTEESIGEAQRYGSKWALFPFEAMGPRSGDIAHSAGKEACVYIVNSRREFVTAYDAGIRVMMTDAIPLLKAAAAGN